MIIAIDGPAGSGKSTVAKLLARRLGFHFLDTGAMYRAVSYRALTQDISLADEPAVASVAASETVTFGHEPGDPLPSRVLIGGIDVTREIRSPEVDEAVSLVAKLPSVREAMVARQREIAESDNVVVEGRDIGTVVFPDAALKVFLTASPEERARRRAADKALAGDDIATAEVAASLQRRDAIDSQRAHSPLTAAADAVKLDTTDLTLEQVVDEIARLACQRM